MTRNLLLLFVLTIFQFSCAQERSKAESAVKNFMKKTDAAYQPMDFGEFFVQTYPKEVQGKLGTNKQVKYALVHTFKTDTGTVSNMYFHLTDKYEVIGRLTDQQMMALTLEIAGPKLDSIMNFMSDSLSAPPRK